MASSAVAVLRDDVGVPGADVDDLVLEVEVGGFQTPPPAGPYSCVPAEFFLSGLGRSGIV